MAQPNDQRRGNATVGYTSSTLSMISQPLKGEKGKENHGYVRTISNPISPIHFTSPSNVTILI